MIFELMIFELKIFELTTFELTTFELMILGAIELAYDTESAVQLPYNGVSC
jgi:hypothetical protein